MPLPTPKSGESSKAFIGRCASTESMKREYPKQSQRLAVCFSQLRRARKKK